MLLHSWEICREASAKTVQDSLPGTRSWRHRCLAECCQCIKLLSEILGFQEAYPACASADLDRRAALLGLGSLIWITSRPPSSKADSQVFEAKIIKELSPDQSKYDPNDENLLEASNLIQSALNAESVQAGVTRKISHTCWAGLALKSHASNDQQSVYSALTMHETSGLHSMMSFKP